MVTWGKKTGQIAIISLFGVFLGFMLFVFPIKAFSQHDHIFWGVFFFFATVLVVQLIVAYLGIRYLARLPAKEKNLSTAQCKSQERSMVDQINNECKMSQRHKEALLPFGIMGTFAIILVLFIFAMSIGEKYVAPHLPFPFGIFFILIFFGPPSYNYLPSSFQKERDIIASSTGGGSIFLFHGCWPFFRLIAYKDGVEVRFMFHRFFIPYNKINEIPSEVSFFTRGILIKSDLPDVPSDIRFSGFGMKKIVGAINEAKREYLRGTK